MVNQVLLIGRLTADPVINETENKKKVLHVTLAVQRGFKNPEGIYETDFIRCTMWNAVAASTSEYCHKGDIVGVRGRIQVSSYKDEEDNTKYSTEVVADKITFLSSKSSDVEGHEIEETDEE